MGLPQHRAKALGQDAVSDRTTMAESSTNLTSVSTVLNRIPLREFLPPRPAQSCDSKLGDYAATLAHDFRLDEPSLSRGTAISTGPTSISAVLMRLPLRELPPFFPAGSCWP